VLMNLLLVCVFSGLLGLKFIVGILSLLNCVMLV